MATSDTQGFADMPEDQHKEMAKRSGDTSSKTSSINTSSKSNNASNLSQEDRAKGGRTSRK